MPLPPDRVIWEWIDVGSNFLRASNWIRSGGVSGPIAFQLQALSNAELEFVTQSLPALGTVTPSGGQFRLTQDVALLNFQTIPGTSIQIAIPAPLLSVFGPNSTVVDPTNPGVIALITQVINAASDQAGNPVTAYIGGSKASRRTEQL